MDAEARGWLLVDARVSVGRETLTLALEAEAPRVALIGPSGAGKTTALRVLVGVERRAQGRVVVDGTLWQDSATDRFLAPHLRQAAWVPQEASLFPHRSVRENLAWAALRGDEAELQRVAALLEVEGLLERRPRHLSGGERQRVALGRALLARPRVLLLDEPFSALDRARRKRVTQAVAEECEARGMRLVLVSHDEADVGALADEVFEIEGGITRRAGAARA